MDKSVEALSSLLGIESEILKASLKDDTLDSRIADFKAKQKILPVSDFEKLSSNLQREAVTKYQAELADKIKSGDIEPELYKPMKGKVLEMEEKKLAKKYGIMDYDNLEDLIDKVKTTSGGNADSELTKKIEDLKKVNKLLEEKAQEAERNSDKKIKDTLLGIHKEKILNSLPFDAGTATGKEADEVKANASTILTSLFDRDYTLEIENGNVYVKDKTGAVLKDSATLDPLSPDVVYMSIAKKFGIQMKSPEAGGLGGRSSANSNHGVWTKEAYLKEVEKAKDTNEVAMIRRKYKKENPAIEI